MHIIICVNNNINMHIAYYIIIYILSEASNVLALQKWFFYVVCMKTLFR